MAKYNLHLKGYVGAADFNSRSVDSCLAENSDRDVTVLIDSTGGSLATGLSIAAAFRNHGAVDVHFVGLNASAATVASLGARTITMDRSAMYLVHKCSNFVFAWQSMNADELDAYIADLTKNKADLDKIDDNIAAMYAARCRKDPKDLIELMKKGAWLNSKEALEWGFIDKITDYEEDQKPRVTASLADDFKAAGIPLPGKIEKESKGLSSIFTALREFMNSGRKQPEDETETGAASLRDVEDTAGTEVTDIEDSADAAETTNPDVEDNSQSQTPQTKTVVENSVSGKSDAGSFGSFIDTGISARNLFRSLP